MADKSAETIFDSPVDNDTIGNRIIRAREAAGLKSATVARNMGVRSTTIENWERDRSEPRPHHLVRLSGMLGVSPAWLLSGRGQTPLSDTIADEVQIIHGHLRQLKEYRDQTSQTISQIEKTLERIVELDRETETL